MEAFKIVCGKAKECEKELNELRLKNWVNVQGFTATNELTTVLVSLAEKE